MLDSSNLEHLDEVVSAAHCQVHSSLGFFNADMQRSLDRRQFPPPGAALLHVRAELHLLFDLVVVDKTIWPSACLR